MANAREQLGELRGMFTDFVADVDARLNQLQEAQGNFTPEAQAEFDALKQAVSEADGRVGDADGSDTPAEPAPEPEPAPEGTEPI